MDHTRFLPSSSSLVCVDAGGVALTQSWEGGELACGPHHGHPHMVVGKLGPWRQHARSFSQRSARPQRPSRRQTRVGGLPGGCSHLRQTGHTQLGHSRSTDSSQTSHVQFPAHTFSQHTRPGKATKLHFHTSCRPEALKGNKQNFKLTASKVVVEGGRVVGLLRCLFILVRTPKLHLCTHIHTGRQWPTQVSAHVGYGKA